MKTGDKGKCFRVPFLSPFATLRLCVFALKNNPGIADLNAVLCWVSIVRFRLSPFRCSPRFPMSLSRRQFTQTTLGSLLTYSLLETLMTREQHQVEQIATLEERLRRLETMLPQTRAASIQ